MEKWPIIPILPIPSVSRLVEMQEDARAAINAVTGISTILDSLPFDPPTSDEMQRGQWMRRMLVNKATGMVEVETIEPHDFYAPEPEDTPGRERE